MSYAVGSLVRARSREWVVLPESQDDFLMLRPLWETSVLNISFPHPSAIALNAAWAGSL